MYILLHACVHVHFMEIVWYGYNFVSCIVENVQMKMQNLQVTINFRFNHFRFKKRVLLPPGKMRCGFSGHFCHSSDLHVHVLITKVNFQTFGIFLFRMECVWTDYKIEMQKYYLHAIFISIGLCKWTSSLQIV